LLRQLFPQHPLLGSLYVWPLNRSSFFSSPGAAPNLRSEIPTLPPSLSHLPDIFSLRLHGFVTSPPISYFLGIPIFSQPRALAEPHRVRFRLSSVPPLNSDLTYPHQSDFLFHFPTFCDDTSPLQLETRLFVYPFLMIFRSRCLKILFAPVGIYF